MTVKELIEQEEVNTGKSIGDEIALAIYDSVTSEEYYFEDCRQAESSGYDYDDLINAKVVNHEYVENYCDLDGKLKLNIEVE